MKLDAIDQLGGVVQDFDRFCPSFLHIIDKEAREIPFRLNSVQRRILELKRAAIYAGRPRRFIILKSRRVGVTTEEQAISFWKVATQRNRMCLTLAHTYDAAETMFRTADLFYRAMDERIRPGRLTDQSKKDLNFPGLNSLYLIGTARSMGIGRGLRFDRVHWTEAPYSQMEIGAQRRLLAGISQAAKLGEVVIEATANGVGDLFHEMWVDAAAGKSEYTPIFVPWWEDTDNVVPLSPDDAARLQATYTSEEYALATRHGLTPGQIAWRRAAKASADLRDVFDQEYPEDPTTAFLVSGTTFFDKAILNKLAPLCGDPIETRGDTRIWEKPVKGRRYAIGGDVAEGTPTGNYSVGAVLDAESLAQVACLRGKWRPEDFAVRLAELGREYNEAIIGVERNNHGHSCLNTLSNQLGYPKLYHHLDYDAASKRHVPKLGWPTDPKTRPILLDDLRTAVERELMPVRDRVFIDECRTFVKEAGDKYAAREGKHDDTIFGWGIALQVRKERGSEVGTVSSSFDPMEYAKRQGRVF